VPFFTPARPPPPPLLSCGHGAGGRCFPGVPEPFSPRNFFRSRRRHLFVTTFLTVLHVTGELSFATLFVLESGFPIFSAQLSGKPISVSLPFLLFLPRDVRGVVATCFLMGVSLFGDAPLSSMLCRIPSHSFFFIPRVRRSGFARQVHFLEGRPTHRRQLSFPSEKAICGSCANYPTIFFCLNFRTPFAAAQRFSFPPFPPLPSINRDFGSFSLKIELLRVMYSSNGRPKSFPPSRCLLPSRRGYAEDILCEINRGLSSRNWFFVPPHEAPILTILFSLGAEGTEVAGDYYGCWPCWGDNSSFPLYTKQSSVGVAVLFVLSLFPRVKAPQVKATGFFPLEGAPLFPRIPTRSCHKGVRSLLFLQESADKDPSDDILLC